MVFQEGYTLAHALYALFLEFVRTGGDGMKHVLHVGVVEQRTMNDAAMGQVIESGATDLYGHLS